MVIPEAKISKLLKLVTPVYFRDYLRVLGDTMSNRCLLGDLIFERISPGNYFRAFNSGRYFRENISEKYFREVFLGEEHHREYGQDCQDYRVLQSHEAAIKDERYILIDLSIISF